MVDVGEQTGALPDDADENRDTCEKEVDNNVTDMTSPARTRKIVFLAVIVGSIVIAMFLPLLAIMPGIRADGRRTDLEA